MTSDPKTRGVGLSGVRRWIVVAAGLGLMTLGAFLLLPRAIEGRWEFWSQGRNDSHAVLLIDTAGGPLRSEGGPQVSQWVEGYAAPGFAFRARARSGRDGDLTLRLVDPSGALRWERTVPRGGVLWIPRTALDVNGTWRFDVESRSRAAVVRLLGDAHASRWVLAGSGPAMPIGWIGAGIVAAIAVWFGRAGSRIAGGVLLAVGLSTPSLMSVFHDLLVPYPPGGRALGVAAIALAASGALALGWTWPHPVGPPPRRWEVVVGAAGVLLVGYALRDARPYEIQRLGFTLTALAGLLVVASSGWLVGRRSASPASWLTARVVGWTALASVSASAAVALLVGGMILAILAGSGIGLNDDGPDLLAATEILIVSVVGSAILGFVAVRSFRAADIRGRRSTPSDPARPGSTAPPRDLGVPPAGFGLPS